ncbi:MAG: PEP-CTERM sorting domain-containing protein [Pseudomonadota bacterium]|nr:PEP-CTERM sorting domain-containing protein [Pseudomonadota bacterium]
MILTSIFHAKTAAPRAALGKFLGAAVFGASALMSQAHAETITFEGYSGLVGGTDTIQTAGFNLGFYANVAGGGPGAFVGMFADGTDPQGCASGACPVNNPGTYYAALNDSYIDLSFNGDRSFSIKSFDASFIGGNPTLSSYPALSGILEIQAITVDGATVFADFALNGPNANGFQFGQFSTGAFGNLALQEAFFYGLVCNSVGQCDAFNSDRAQFGIDNLAVSVPEPSTKLTFGLGLLGMLAFARRRKV